MICNQLDSIPDTAKMKVFKVKIIHKSIQIFLEAHISSTTNDLVVRLWVYITNFSCLNPSRTAYCISVCNEVIIFFTKALKKIDFQVRIRNSLFF